jgi:tRNA1Val (adenine37-N6)-methyltransferase
MYDSATETLDELSEYNLNIAQPRLGYRFSLDPLLLARFAAVVEGERIADLGTGCGVIPMVMSRLNPRAIFVGVEFQLKMAELARRNVAVNGLAGRISIVSADILSLREQYTSDSFDLVLANPPFRKQGTGRISPRPGRDVARHETTAKLADFFDVAHYLVRQGGSICFVYHVSRLSEFLVEAERLCLSPARLQFVHGTPQAEARMFLVELVKGRRGDLKVLPPVVVHDLSGDTRKRGGDG